MQRLAHILRQAILLPMFSSSKAYWERRYRLGGSSGEGSLGPLAEFKAETLNAFVRKYAVTSVIEFGCGDGSQLSLAEYPLYLGQDVSMAAVRKCRDRYKDDTTKSFLWYDPADAPNITAFLNADLTLSLDVVYHLVEDSVYQRYISDLFAASRRFVIVYSSNTEGVRDLPHVRHREFTVDVERFISGFRLVRTMENRYPEQSPCRFFVFERTQSI